MWLTMMQVSCLLLHEISQNYAVVSIGQIFKSRLGYEPVTFAIT